MFLTVKGGVTLNPQRRLFLAGCGSAAARLAWPGSPALAQPRAGGSLTVASVNMRHLNPAIQPGNATGVPGTQIFTGLVTFDDRFVAQPCLAESWEVAKDGLGYTFQLRRNAVFHDGKPITARDVAFSIETVRTHHPLLSVTFRPIFDSVEALDSHVVRLKLKKPYSAMLNALGPATMPILPEHIYGTGPIQNHPANERPVGSGPFRFVDWKPGESLILERHPEYFRAGRPYLDRIAFRIVEDPTTKALLMDRGEIDFLPFSFLRITDVVRLKRNPAVMVTTRGYEALGPINYLEMNLREAPLNDERVRHAIAYAIDKKFIVERLHAGLSRQLDGPLHHGNPFQDDAALKLYPFDLEGANRLLDEAGHARGADGNRFQLTLDIPTFNTDSTLVVAEYLKQQLRKIGLDIVLRRSTDLADWSSRISSWRYQLTMNSTFNYPDPAIGVSRSFVCDNIKKVIWTNTEGYCNHQVDDWLTAAATERDEATRRELYSRFQSQVTADLPFIWTNEEPYTTLYKAGLRGVPLGVWGAMAPWDELQLPA